MTDEGRQNILIGALVLSVLLHVGMMIVMRPQVMTHILGSENSKRGRDPMVITAPPPRPDTIQIETVQDVAALKDSPAAIAEVLPTTSEMSELTPESAQTAPELDIPEFTAAPLPELEVVANLSEKITVAEESQPAPTPLAGESLVPRAPQTATVAPEVGLDAEAFLPAEVPLFTAPEILPTALLTEVSPPETLNQGRSERETKEFVPPEEVLEKVDEKIVEAEKAAVRDLLDAQNVNNLDAAVSLSAESASAGEWTYFRVQMTPNESLPIIPKDVVVLFDASGSIGDDRLRSCRKAARTLLRSSANTGDRFNLVAFRDRFTYAFRTWQDCNQKAFDAADKWMNNLAAYGRTDVFSVVRSVLTLPRDPERPLIALVVTDGDANAGVSQTAQILSRFTKLNDGLISVYMYGVKSSANRELIDVLTHGNRGEGFIHDGSRWSAGAELEGFSQKFRDPVLSDLRVVFTTASQAEIYPKRFKNLYRGETLEIIVRVPKGIQTAAFSLKGLNGKNPYEAFFKIDLPKATFNQELPTVWKSEQAIDLKLR